jgi:hypothetical protein
VGPDTCWTYYCITAHTGVIGEHFDSPPDRGYSVDNLGMLRRPSSRSRTETRDSDPVTRRRTYLEVPEPNPSRDGFAVRFELGQPDWVELEVYDVMGRRVAVLKEGFVSGGAHSVAWESTGASTAPLSPGLYFVRLMTSEEVHTAKIVLIE